MGMFKRLRGGGAYRRVVKALDRIAYALEAQNQQLARLADHFVPQLPVGDVADTGASFGEDPDLVAALDYVSRVQRQGGRHPTDDEIVAYLADVRNRDLLDRRS
jgi:hypothetical protein